MAHTYSRSYALVTLTLSAATAFVQDDYITGATSGAVGIVANVIDTTHIDVYEMSSTAFAPTENVSNVAGTTESCTARAASTTTTLPADAAEVIGSDSSVTNIFRKIADISGIGGVTNPSSTQAFLGLEMKIYFGREGQSSDTYCISKNENVRFGDTGAQGGIRLISSSTNDTYCSPGFHKYEDDDLDNYPPLYVQDGSILDFRCSNADGVAINIDTNSHFYVNDTVLKGDGILNGYYINVSGELRLTNSYIEDFTGFITTNTDSKFYFNNLYVQEISQAIVLASESPTYGRNLYFQNNVSGAAVFYSFFANWEASFEGVFTYDDNGDLWTDPLGASGLGYYFAHCVNSDIDVTKWQSLFNGAATHTKELSFKIKVVDESGNPIENATVSLRNQYAEALFRITDVNPTANVTNTATSITFTGAHGMSVGDYFRLGVEEMKVLTVPSSTQVTMSRAQNGTVARKHKTATILAVSELATTDSNGEIAYESRGNGKNAVFQETAEFTGTSGVLPPITGTHITYTDFILKVQKDGYETYKQPIDLSGYEGIDCGIKLRHSPTPGRDDMSEEFR